MEEPEEDHTEESLDAVVNVINTAPEWSFDTFELAKVSEGKPMKYIFPYMLNYFDLLKKFNISCNVVDTFVERIEEGYRIHPTVYHTNVHGADVAQAVFYMIAKTGLQHALTDLQIFTTIFAALVHDYEHTGKTNRFLKVVKSNLALLYNDTSVQENHHVSATFFLLEHEECNILKNLTKEQYVEVRSLAIDLILGTDMAFHFEHLREIKDRMTDPVKDLDISRIMTMLLHTCDISCPAKEWRISYAWANLVMEEFFLQGDLERQLGLPISVLCDRETTSIPEAQIHFTDFIVEPSLKVCGDMLDYVLEPIAIKYNILSEGTTNENGETSFRILRPWEPMIAENRKQWKKLAAKGKFLIQFGV